jgi:hypothetical protein
MPETDRPNSNVKPQEAGQPTDVPIDLEHIIASTSKHASTPQTSGPFSRLWAFLKQLFRAEAAHLEEDLEQLAAHLFPWLDGDFPLSDEQILHLLRRQGSSQSQIYDMLEQIQNDLHDYFSKVPEVMPALLQGQLLNPDGTPAACVSVTATLPDSIGPLVYARDIKEALSPLGDHKHHDDPPLKGGPRQSAWISPQTLTDTRGSFALPLPPVPLRKRAEQDNGDNKDNDTGLIVKVLGADRLPSNSLD